MDQFNPKILQQFRKLLYPAIAQRIITGYNVYNQPKDITDTSLHYLHSDLGVTENGKADKHLEALVKTLQDNFPTNRSILITNAVVRRYAVYLLGDWKENPNNVIFYDVYGNPLTKMQESYDRNPVIVEGRQYDLSIQIDSKKQRRDLMRLLYKHTHFFIVGKKHVLRTKTNPCAIVKSWEIPLIMCNQNAGLMTEAEEICLKSSKHEARIIMRDTSNIRQFVNDKTIEICRYPIYVNKTFYVNFLERNSR